MAATKKVWGYWIATVLFCLAILPGGFFNLLLTDQAREIMSHLGYPDYFGRILGAWKILGVIALLVPGRPRLKEWAYAGFTFDITGASLSYLGIGAGPAEIFPPLIFLGMLAVSYFLRPSSRSRLN